MDTDFSGSGDFRQSQNDRTSEVWTTMQAPDPDLSELLDQVIDFVPDSVVDDLGNYKLVCFL